MDRTQYQQFVYDLVDETIEHVFLRFPERAADRAEIYRYISDMLLEIADDLDLA